MAARRAGRSRAIGSLRRGPRAEAVAALSSTPDPPTAAPISAVSCACANSTDFALQHPSPAAAAQAIMRTGEGLNLGAGRSLKPSNRGD